MDRIRIVGGQRLNGTIPISGAKNAALPLMITSLMSDEPLTLSNVPHLADVNLLVRILGNHGVDVTVAGKRAGQRADTGQTMRLAAANIADTTAPYELISRMRASFWVLGPLLARCGEARVSLPGGCAIGTRPVDFYIAALREMGAMIELEEGYVVAKAPKGGLRGARIEFPRVSVGATHVAMMAAALAKGSSVLSSAAREPEVEDVAVMLNAMGASISGGGEEMIEIEGVGQLDGTTHRVIPDRIEAGTFAVAAAITGGDVVISDCNPAHLTAVLELLQQIGVDLEQGRKTLLVRSHAPLRSFQLETKPYPGFPTDMQAQFCALATCCHGTSTIVESIFENRAMHAPELARLGADIEVHGRTITVRGPCALTSAPVMASDLRASAALVLAGLVAEGGCLVNRIYHLDRGYENLESKLVRLGASILRISE